MSGMYYKCDKCEWVGKRTGTMDAGVIKKRICPKCTGISNVTEIGYAKPKKEG